MTDARAYDACLLRVAEHGDRDAFEQLFDHYAPRVKSYLMRGGSSPEAAEELAQEAMVTLWRKAHLFDPKRASASAWIFTIARNLQIDAYRRAKTAIYAADPILEEEPPPLPDARLLDSQAARQVRAALTSLNPDQARAIEMAFFQEQTHLQISVALGVPLGTIKARIRFGMMKMRAWLDRETEGAQS